MKTDPEQTAELSAFHELEARDVPRQLYEMSSNAVIVADLESRRIVALNAAGQRLLRLSQREARQHRLEHLLPRADPARIVRLIRRFARLPRTSLGLSLHAGLDLPHGTDLFAFHIPGRDPTLAIIIQDYRSKGAALDKAARAEDQLRSAIEALPDGFALYDAEDRLAICNERYLSLYAASAPAIKPGARFEDIIRYGLANAQYPEAIGREADWLEERMTAHRRSNQTLEQQLEDGRWLRIHEHLTASGGRVGLRVDITDLKRQKEKLHETLRTDELTGLLNRRGLRDDLAKMRATMDHDHPCAMFHINLNRFRLINEVHGSDVGDEVLRRVARCLRNRIAPDDLLARIGADEFIAICVGGDETFDPMAAAYELIGCLAEARDIGRKTITLSCNVGVVACDEDNMNEDEVALLAAAALALNAAQDLGRDEAALFNTDMRRRAMLENEMALEVEAGLGRNEVLPFFQPQIDTASGRVIGFEALVRWCHPERGLVPAHQFLKVAQRAGLTEAIDDLMMDKSCAAARQLLDWGKTDASVSINVSGPQISDPDIVRRLTGHLQAHGLSPRHIHVELLESTLLDDRTSQIIQNVRDLIDAGFSIELDDFGTGHAAIATLRRFAVSRIKIDRSLVQHIDTDDELQLITSAVINLASDLGIDALAEGVETQAEQQLLRRIGCKCAQGYLHAKPMPLDELRVFLADRGELSPCASAYRRS